MSMKLLAAAVVAALLVATASASCQPPAQDLFVNSVDWSCPNNFQCLTDFCSCVGGSLTERDSNWPGCAPSSWSNSNVTHQAECTARHITCILKAALSAADAPQSQPAQCTMSPLVKAYEDFYYAADRSMSNLTTSCLASACMLFNGQDSVYSFPYICSLVDFDFPVPRGNQGGGGGLPQHPSCPVGRQSYLDTSKLPVAECPALHNCVQAWCTNNGWTFADNQCGYDLASASLSAYEGASRSYIGCLASAAVSLYPDGGMATSPCEQWSTSFMNDYARYFYSNNRQSTTFYTECASPTCNFEMMVFNQTGNIDSLCLQDSLPTPPYNPNNQGSGSHGGGGGGLPQHPSCPSSQQSYLQNLPVQCGPVATCLQAWCTGNGWRVVDGQCQVNITSATLQAYEQTSVEYVRCLAGAAVSLFTPGHVDGNSSQCEQWSSYFMHDYARYFYSDNRTATNFYSACASPVCNFEMFAFNMVGNVNSVCLQSTGLPTPSYDPNNQGGGGGGDGLPQSPLCPAHPSDLVADTPKQCPNYADCERTFCACVKLNYTQDRGCDFDPMAISEEDLNVCAPRFFRCNVNASISNFPGPNGDPRNVCHNYSARVVNAYSQYTSATNKSATQLYEQCSSIVCNVMVFAHNRTAQNVPALCDFTGLPPPPGGNNNGGSSVCSDFNGPNLFDKMPVTKCSSLLSCVTTFCQCTGGTIDAATGDCKPGSGLTQATARTCLGNGLTCIVGAALAYYVPGSDASDISLSTCGVWAIPFAREYAAYFNATGAAKTQTALYGACNSTACHMLLENYVTSIDLAPTCAFSGLTSTPTYVAPKPFVCPDNTTAKNLANCSCTLNAAISGVDAQFERSVDGSMFELGNAVVGSAYGSYAVASGNCSSFDFRPFLRFSWVLRNSTSTVFAANGSSLRVPATALRPSTSYTLTLTATGLVSSATTTRSWTFTVVTPPPVVSITKLGATLRLPNAKAIVIPTSIVDAFPGDSPQSSWSCVASVGACPVMTNATQARLVIPANSDAGTFTITFTYKGVSSSLTLTIVSDVIPVVKILATGTPVVPALNMYLPSQNILLATSVVFNGSVRFSWSVGSNANISQGRTLILSANSAFLTKSADPTTPTSNTITLRVTSASNPDIYGEASTTVTVTPAYSLTLTVNKEGDGAATSVVGMTENVQFGSVVSAVLPTGAVQTRLFGFYAEGKLRPLNTVPSGANFVVQAPMPTGTGNSVAVVFSVVLRINGVDAAATNQTFTVTKPDLAAAAAASLAQAAAITDPVAAVAAATNMKALMAASNDPAEKAKLAAALVSMLSNAVTDMSSQSKEQQAAIFDTLTTAVNGQASDDTKKELAAKALAMVANAVSSGNFDPSNGQAALNVLATTDLKDASATVGKLADAMANDPNLPVGEVRTISAPGVTISTVKQSASDLAGFSVDSDGGTFAMGDDFAFPDVGEDSVVGIASAAYATNPYTADASGTNPEGKVVSYKISVDGATFLVQNLTSPLSIGLEGASTTAICKFWDEAAQEWSTFGVTTVIINGQVTCRSNHLTAFASFSGSTSSAATVLLSVLVAVVLAAVQLVIA